MLTKDSQDKEILDCPFAGTTIREVGSMTFMAWVATKMNGVQAYKADTQELLGLISNPPIGKIPDIEKIRIIRKLLNLGILL